jgi:ABC-type transport system involved in multi-copper enzyme maturation permease subunit
MLCPVSRHSIIAGKFAASMFLGSFILLWGVVSLALAYLWSPSGMSAQDVQSFTPSLASLCASIGFSLCTALVFTAAGLAAGTRSSNDTVIVMFSCVVLLVVELLAGVLFLPPRSISTLITIVPVSNVAICLRDAFTGKLNWVWAALTVLSSVVYTVLLSAAATAWLAKGDAALLRMPPMPWEKRKPSAAPEEEGEIRALSS